METRELRYFVAVAEESHFGRAAQRLGIAQPALTRAVQKMERRLGTPLFVRAGRTIHLTAAGTVLLDEGRHALDAVDAADRRTRRAGRAGTDRPGIVLVAKAGVSVELLAKLLDAFAAEPDAVPVEVVLAGLEPDEPERMMRDGRADVALLHEPSAAGFDYEDITTEGRMAVLPAGHPLTSRASLTEAALPDLPQLCQPVTDGAGPVVRDGTQLFQMISLGRAFAVLPESTRPSLPAGVTAVPLTGVPPIAIRIVWPSHSRSLPVAALVRVATRL
jgi:LysR family transcriptional regulator, benzoate and cis,cis-muconate-responsive activator of ben and cat genes